MPHFLPLRLLPVIAAALALSTQSGAQPSRTALTPGTLAITGVTVIPMTADTAIADATVLVRDGRIAAVGPRRRPSGYRQVHAASTAAGSG